MDETMDGVIRALIEEKPDYPIVIRRSGPGEDRAMQMLKTAAEENNLKMEIFNRDLPMTKSAQILVERVNGN